MNTPSAVSLQSGREIEISIDQRYRRELSEDWLRMVADCALEVALPPGQTGQMSLLVSGDATVQRLNREYRGLDEVTDVLSFSPSHPGHWEGGGSLKADGLPFILPPDQLPVLGDVAISYPQARRQARARNEPVPKELALLLIHGVLHLVGYDHREPEETALMQAQELAALSAAFQDRTQNR